MITPDIMERSAGDLVDYAKVPMSFEVRTVLDVQVIDGGLGGFALSEREVEIPYVKDYDAFGGGETPAGWATRWDISKWGIFSAFVERSCVGGCVVAYDTPGIHMLEGRQDVAVLWDIRVHPDHRRKGIGSQLFQRAAAWARQRNCRALKAETQNINVPACRFYARQGCALGVINRHAYVECPDEVELVWFLEL